jgi:WD40 repeat protein
MAALPQAINNNCPKPPSFYADTELLTYANQWKQVDKPLLLSETAVFGLTFFQDSWLIGCTGQGEVCVWKLATESNEILGKNRSEDVIATSSPVLKLKVLSTSDGGVLYACKMVKRSDDVWWLVVSGDDGILILDWNGDILPKINKNVHLSPTFQKQFRPFPSPFEPSIEVNDFVIHGNYLYGAAGDAFGCYKWDLATDKLVTTYKSTAGGGYLHTLDLVANSNLLLLGGEDGSLGIWDISQDKIVDTIDMNPSSSLQTKKRRASTRWISSCKARDENWWFVAGGRSSHNKGGFLSTLHGPTRSVVSTVNTIETPQQLALYGNTLLSVANESFVSHWKNALSLEDAPPQRVWSHQASAYAVAVSGSGQLIATGGIGEIVDIFEEGTQYGRQLTTREDAD